MLDSILFIILALLFFFTVFYIFTIPIKIGVSRDLPDSTMRWIRILTWCGLVTGCLWFIALFLALTGERTSRP